MKNSEIIEMTTAELIERVETEKAALNKMTMNHTITPMETRCEFVPPVKPSLV